MQSIQYVGWVKAMRTSDALELIRANPFCYVMAATIALRARWTDGFNADGLEQGEALIGDFEQQGMTEQQYRTTKAQLAKWGFATFRPTTRGTIAKLTDTRLFSLFIPDANGRNNGRPTDDQRTTND